MRYSLIELMLNEYTDKLINQMYAVYKPQTTDSDDQIKQNIKDYDRLRGAVDAKLKQNNPAVLRAVPDDLKKNDKFKDITSIKDYNTLVRIIKSVTKKEVDIYKQAIEYFKKKDIYQEPRIIGMYVGQFKKNKDRITQAINAKDETVLSLIPDEILKANKGADILSYKNFSDLERLIDGAFPFEGKEKEELNSAESDGELVYKNDSDGIEIYRGDNEHRCVKYGKNQYYSWCISRVAGSMYSSYRFRQLAGSNKMFYFVFDRTQTDAKEGGRFVNPYHAVVINAYENGKYARTTAQNDGDDPYSGTEWDKLGQYFKGEDGQRMWNKIKGLQKYMPFSPPSAEERRQLGFRGQRLTLDSFIDLDAEDKQAWLRANAGDRNLITSEIVKSLDNEQINDLINYDRKFSFDELKKSQGLLKRYADYRFTRYPNNALPYNFISYLKPELQEKYYDKFEEDYLTFDIIEKFFNEDVLKKYISKQIDDLSYLPEKAKKYMDNEQKQLFDLYSTVFKDSTFVEKPVDENSTDAPSQSISVPSLSQESFNRLNTNDKKKLIDFYVKIANDPKNIQKYAAFFVGFPISFKLNNKMYFVTPSSKGADTFIIMDENGKTIYNDLRYVDFFKDNNRVSSNQYIQKQTGSKSIYLEPDDFDSIIVQNNDGEDQKIDKNDFGKKLDEILLENYYNRKLKFRAGIIK